SVTATTNGFRVLLTQPVSASAINDSVQVQSWAYRDAPDYGSPEMDTRDESVNVSVEGSGKTLLLELADPRQPELHPQQTARVYQITLSEGLMGSESPQLNAFYSLWQFAETD
ncbi:MAG: hypothetical protein RLN96_10520, partial [Pseudomonadales bacterium]